MRQATILTIALVKGTVMQKGMVVVGLGVACLVAGCATPTVVEVKQTGDASLSCSQIKDQLELADKYLKDAKKERTVTGTNVAAAIFFLPGLLGTYVNTEEAMNAAKERQALLNKLAERKKCKLDAEAAAVEEPIKSSPNVTNTVTTQTPVQVSVDNQPASMTNMEVQKKLLALGYQAGTADGIMGKKSIDALKKFQQDNNLPSTGQADYETMGKLRQKTRH
jgi:hypothetical protein